MLLPFILGAIVYSIGAVISNSLILKGHDLYILYGVMVGIVANVIWFSMAQRVIDPSKILMLGFYWDIMIVCCFTTIPVLFYGATLSWTKIIGLGIIFIGIVLTKL